MPRPNIDSPTNYTFRPSSATSLGMDGNPAHSTGWWWDHAGAFYFGGALYLTTTNYVDNIAGTVRTLEYNPGRSFSHVRRPCKVNPCELGECDNGCPVDQRTFVRMSNSKAFQVAGVGFNSWSGPMEILGWETHDTGLSIESRSESFWIDNMLAVCRYVLVFQSKLDIMHIPLNAHSMS